MRSPASAQPHRAVLGRLVAHRYHEVERYAQELVGATLLLASDKGIVRDGDILTLDAHARQDAERFLQEVLGPDTVGTWRPTMVLGWARWASWSMVDARRWRVSSISRSSALMSWVTREGYQRPLGHRDGDLVATDVQ